MFVDIQEAKTMEDTHNKKLKLTWCDSASAV